LGLLDNPVKRLIENQYVIKGPSRRILCKADRSCGIGLGIAINEESRVFGSSKASGKIYCRGRLADAAFLVSNCNNSGQIFPRAKLNKAAPRMQDVSRGTSPARGIELRALTLFHVEQSIALTRLEMNLTFGAN